VWAWPGLVKPILAYIYCKHWQQTSKWVVLFNRYWESIDDLKCVDISLKTTIHNTAWLLFYTYLFTYFIYFWFHLFIVFYYANNYWNVCTVIVLVNTTTILIIYSLLLFYLFIYLCIIYLFIFICVLLFIYCHYYISYTLGSKVCGLPPDNSKMTAVCASMFPQRVICPRWVGNTMIFPERVTSCHASSGWRMRLFTTFYYANRYIIRIVCTIIMLVNIIINARRKA